MPTITQIYLLILNLCLLSHATLAADEQYQASPKLTGPASLARDSADAALNQLDAALKKIKNVYMQAVLDGSHSADLNAGMRNMEIELFDQLDTLYKNGRLQEYMKYEAEVTRQMILYSKLKQLFGYSTDENADKAN